MAFKIGDMKTLLSQLTCTRCDKLLSVFPIYMASSIGNVCGRCTQSIEWMISNNCIERNTAYENLARYVLFPCSNKELGCKTNLKYDEVENHEKCCSYRQRMCPFNVDAGDSVLQCDWKGGIVNLNTHLSLSHTSRKIDNLHTFSLNVEETNIKVNYVKVELNIFIVLTRFDGETNKFYCLVMCCAEEAVCKNYAYQMELGRGDDFFLNLRKSNTEALMETSEALEQVQNMIMIDISAAKTLFGNSDSNLNCRISITKKTKEIAESTSMPKEQTNSKPATSLPTTIPYTTYYDIPPCPSPSDAKQNMLRSNKLILEELECPVCNNYMKPPIYICTQGHSLCDECKIKVIECPICRVSSINIRNFTLEKLTQKVLYPCKYSLYGCTEVLSVNIITQHEITCNFKTSCPLKMLPVHCSVKEGIMNPIGHINEKHSQLILREHMTYSRCVKSSVTSSYHVAITNNDVFIVCCKNSPTTGPLKFNFLHLGMKKNVPIYRYRLEFVDQSKLGLKLIVKQVCQSVPPSVSNAFQNCLAIPLDMLEPYMLKNTVFYKFNLEQI